MKKNIQEKVKIPEGVHISLNNGTFHVKGPKGEVARKMVNPKVAYEIKDGSVIFSAKKATKREKRMIGTFSAHLNQMIIGVTRGHEYKLKVCSSHFPITAEVSGKEFVVKNFLGEHIPRKFKIQEGVNVKVEGDIVTVSSPNREIAGCTAGAIEQVCRITNRDRRIFQDGIYITSKPKREIK